MRPEVHAKFLHWKMNHLQGYYCSSRPYLRGRATLTPSRKARKDPVLLSFRVHVSVVSFVIVVHP